MAVALARAGVEVDLACRTAEQAAELAITRRNERYLGDVELPAAVTVRAAADVELDHHDLVVFAVPARALPQAVAAHAAGIPRRAGVLVLAKGLVPGGALPSAYVAERTHARAVAVLGGPGHARDAIDHGASLVVASVALAGRNGWTPPVFTSKAECDLNFERLTRVLLDARPFVRAAIASHNLRSVAHAIAYNRARGASEQTFTGLAGAGDLVATVLADGSRNRRAGELLGSGLSPGEIPPRLGQTAEALDALPELAGLLRDAHVEAPATTTLAAVVEGRIPPERWIEQLSARRRAA